MKWLVEPYILDMKLLCLTAVLIYVSAYVTADPDTLFFSPQPEDVTAMEGSNATLRCGASKKQNVIFYWTQDGERIENDTRRYMIGSDLYINRVSPLFDLGEFKCIATNATSGRSIVSRGAQINILWITDTVRVVATSMDFDIGDELVLHCKADGNPETQITWFKNGIRLYKDERITFKNNHMHISDISLKDNGVYSCQAINDVGSVNSSESFSLRISDEKSPHILTVPQNVIAPENTSVLFDCVYETVAATQWYFEERNEPLENSTKYIIYENGSLAVLSIGSSDIGYYRCRGVSLVSDDSPDQEFAALLQLAYLEELSEGSFDPQLKDSEDIVVTVHDSFDITCLPPRGLPRPKMWWENPKGHVINDSGRILVADMRLVFTEVQESDSGKFTCVAENSAGESRISFILLVSVPPVIIKHPTDMIVNEGENAVFQCHYNNTSSATVSWLKDDAYLKDSGNHIIINDENGTLLIRNVGPSDSGSYHCEVQSEEFSSVHSKKATLSVKEKLKFMPAPVNRKLELGSNAKIYCKAGGSTPPVVKWTKIDARSSEWPPHIRDDNGTLHFNRVLSTDTGKYMCVATSSQGIINATIDVDVIVMPKFSVQPSDTVANEGEPVILHCLAEGDPTPIIQWDRNNELNGFNPQRFKVLENGSLYASEIHADDEGKYGCTAGNSGGLRRHEVSLTINAREFNTNRVGRGGFGNEGENTMTKTVAITLGAAGVYIILVVGLMMWCRYRRARRKALMLAQATVDAENSEIIHDMELKDRSSHKNCHNENATNEENCGLMKSPTFSKLQFPRENLSTVMLLGHGEYGEVFLAKATGLKENTETVVMVKALENKEEHVMSDYKRELAMYIKMKHENVGTVLRVCQDVEPHYMIMDYTDWGDLKQFLLATRPEEVTKSPKQSPLSVPQNLMICQQVAVGMEYIAKQQYVHKDLATRNCLISSNLKIKISCPCLSMDTYSQEYYHSKSRVIPVRWAPAEAAIGDNWSTKSDVWSFAVLVWEVFYKAELPFLEMSNEEVIQKLQEGELKHSAPENAPESLVKLLLKCWSPNANDRPSFSEVVAVFVELSVAVQV